jgi:hypothetical protein
MRDKKATGDDDVPGDILRLWGEDGLRTVTQLIDKLHESGEWPKDFTEVTMIIWKEGRSTVARVYMVR